MVSNSYVLTGAYPSPPPQPMLFPDADPTPVDVRPVLRAAWEAPFTTRSDFARENAELIARAACLGWITVQCGPVRWSNVWRITPAGLAILSPLTEGANPLQEDAHGVRH